MKKLQIGVFAWESLYSIKVGGIVPHISELSESLAAKGHDIHIFTRSGGPGDYEQINGVHYHRVTHDQSGSIVNQMDRMCDTMQLTAQGKEYDLRACQNVCRECGCDELAHADWRLCGHKNGGYENTYVNVGCMYNLNSV